MGNLLLVDSMMIREPSKSGTRYPTLRWKIENNEASISSMERLMVYWLTWMVESWAWRLSVMPRLSQSTTPWSCILPLLYHSEQTTIPDSDCTSWLMGRAALDETGRPFEIHHINGRDIVDPHNIENLEVLRWWQHFKTHYGWDPS